MNYFSSDRAVAKLRRGFTLIELLVVIAIIGLLASVVLASLNSVRAKGRDATRKASLKEMQKALELYYDANGSYPSTGGPSSYWGNCSDFGSHSTSGASGYIPNLAPIYISVLPLDPSQTNPNRCYVYTSDGTNYKLLAYLTPETLPLSTSDAFYDPIRPTNTWMVCSGALACATW